MGSGRLDLRGDVDDSTGVACRCNRDTGLFMATSVPSSSIQSFSTAVRPRHRHRRMDLTVDRANPVDMPVIDLARRLSCRATSSTRRDGADGPGEVVGEYLAIQAMERVDVARVLVPERLPDIGLPSCRPVRRHSRIIERPVAWGSMVNSPTAGRASSSEMKCVSSHESSSFRSEVSSLVRRRKSA